jgi:hypothetical protein
MTAMLIIGLTACSKEEEKEEQSNGQSLTSNVSVNDPEGTIALSMRNSNNGDTHLDNIYIENENFRGGYFASIGAVNGLGYVAGIPATGWAQQVSVTEGNGYVAFSDGQYYRIYVVSDIIGTSGGVIGADIKYQKPFKGVDEAIQLPKSEVMLKATNGATAEVIFKNKSIIVYSAASNQSWCRVNKCSTNDFYFLYDGIVITCDENPSSNSREAIVTLKTAYEKEVKLKVTQAGQEPFITMSSNSVEITSKEQTASVAFTSNVNASDLQITGTTSWCKASISTINNTSAKVKFIENAPAKQSSRAANDSPLSYKLNLNLAENTSEDQRSATIIIKHANKNVQASLKVIQKGVTFSVSQKRIVFDRKNNYVTLTVNTTAGSWNAKSSASWCTFTITGDQLTVRATATEKDRTAKITFPSFKEEIVVHQSKYAVGDTYNEGNITGIVGYLGDYVNNEELRFVYKEVGQAVWSLENAPTGATDQYDGRNNMNAIKKIANWKELYPAFALCDSLNNNGITGWYFPSYNESLKRWDSYEIWTSTEANNNEALTPFNHHGYGNDYPKNYSKKVFAIHRF